jgi:hypothetical protein
LPPTWSGPGSLGKYDGAAVPPPARPRQPQRRGNGLACCAAAGPLTRPPAGVATGCPAATELVLPESPAALIRPNLAQRAASTALVPGADGGLIATNRSAHHLACRRTHIPVVLAVPSLTVGVALGHRRVTILLDLHHRRAVNKAVSPPWSFLLVSISCLPGGRAVLDRLPAHVPPGSALRRRFQ